MQSSISISADPYSRVACETMATTNRVIVAGEVRGPSSVTHAAIEEAARDAVRSAMSRMASTGRTLSFELPA